jgi:hypothetical protein
MKRLLSGCWNYREAISLLAAGALQEQERAAIERHLESCQRCRESYRELEWITVPLAGLRTLSSQIEPLPGARARWARAVREAGVAGPRRSRVGKSSFLFGCRELVWPHRYAWLGLAAIWIAFWIVNSMCYDSADTPLKAGGRPQANLPALRELRLRLAEDVPPPLGLQNHAWHEVQLASIQVQLSHIDLVRQMADSLEAEMIVSCSALEQTKCSDFARFAGLRRAWGFLEGLKRPEYWFYAFLPRGWVYQNMVRAAEDYEQAMAQYDPMHHLVLPRRVGQLWSDEQAACIHTAPAHFAPYQTLACMMGPAPYVQVVAATQTFANLALIACALERYRLAHDQYPDELDDLVPDFADRVPVDVIGGQPFKYRREREGFLLYSVGWNEKDDGGSATPVKRLSGDAFESDADWVWPYRGGSIQ